MAILSVSETNSAALKKKLKQLKTLGSGKKPIVSVGVPKGAGQYIGRDGKPKTSLVKVALVNEFGSDDGRIPERSFLRSTVQKNKSEYKIILRKSLKKIIKEPNKRTSILGLVGEKVQDDVKQTIIKMKTPKNAKSTIDKKGEDNPLIDTSQLVGSIRFVIGNE